MSAFWFGVIVGAGTVVFLNSLARENGFARQMVKWVIDKINGIGK